MQGHDNPLFIVFMLDLQDKEIGASNSCFLTNLGSKACICLSP